MEEKNIKRLVSLLSNEGYVPRLPVNPMDLSNADKRQEWINEKNMKAFSFYHNEKNQNVIDIVIDHSFNVTELLSRSSKIKVQNFMVNLIHIDDLITRKEWSGRDRDKSDIDLLKELKRIEENTDDKNLSV